MRHARWVWALGLGLAPVMSSPAWAATGGASLPAVLAIPFAGLLLSIAILPLAVPAIWHHHYGKIAAAWALVTLAGFWMVAGRDATGHALAHTAIEEYLPFLILIGALYIVSGGLLVTGNLHGSPRTNIAILAIGSLLASVIGTTGASMVLIRPIIRANDERRHNVHVIVFFIFLVSNIGGVLTPLGDPPLFLGFLQGVSFFWTPQHLFPEFVVAVVILLAVFYALDRWLYTRDAEFRRLADPTPDTKGLGLEGRPNLVFLVIIVLAVLLSGLWKPGISYHLLGTEISLQDLVRDVVLILCAIASYVTTPKAVHEAQEFTFGPIIEVAKIFAGIFTTMIPVILMLKAGRDGPFSGLIALTTWSDGSPNDIVYFWLSGILSSFLDNAPTYLVFFNLAGGDPVQLMGPMAETLAAISAGAVFMGANSYIGNAPNFMVKAIAEERGIRMPSFFGYMAWSVGILIPLFLLQTWLFFR